MQNPLVSIIVPIYKVEPYLRRCLDSIVNQTYTNLEIILVDDGSPDGCPQICDEYVAKDKRIIVIHKENGGLSDARNAGLDICKGEYISFVDSDDILDLNAVEYMLNAGTDVDIVITNVKMFINEEEINHLNKTHCNSLPFKTIGSDDLLLRLCRDGDAYLRSAWGKLFKRKLFFNIRFPKGKLYEDMYVNYRLYYKAFQSKFIPIPLYYYRQNRPGSIMYKTTSSTFALEAEDERYIFLKEHGKQFIANYNLLSLCWDYLFLYSKKHPGSKEKFYYFSNEFFKNSPKINMQFLFLKFFAMFPFMYYCYRKISPWHIRNY